MNVQDKIDKLRRLADSPNEHEAALAQQQADRLARSLPPVLVSPGGRDPAFPYQLPGVIPVPTPIGGW